ncbi:signal peptidase II [Pseudomonas neustonica]|uniref:Lipoprotein signal peptidase n=1 Tax=Pseudomonas neustonica TaxID=2487346 RepID=A0ABX9XG20_9PSED|nr:MULTISPECIES: signal peptidase II [Pseudomonas]ROZ80359.1 signal peptidase II [Pseudomonas sp. SSM44]ROZ81185.1 signal peptidase II [Pseudomonas neustonica]WOD12344.1 signal peptidase II [Pseudomonas sp. NyZ704]|tara:strand:- start:424 stop:936 length:513 start_codon:yes stop_codon:yes gene_type:complete
MSIAGKKFLPYTLLAISGLIAASDQVVKWLVQQSMAYGESIPVTPFFNWVHVWNTGAAFSLFADGGGWQRYFLIAIAVVVSIVLIRLILQCRRRGEAIAYSLILGGAVGNLIDRIFRGYVVDSFDVYWQSWHWPAFNLADIAIVLGTVLFLYVSFIPEKSGTNAAPDGSG